MVIRADKQRLKKLLVDAIRLLCKNGLAIDSEFHIEATIGITLSESNIMLISFKEHVCRDGSVISQMLTDDELEPSNADSRDVYCIEDSTDGGSQGTSSLTNTHVHPQVGDFVKPESASHEKDPPDYDVSHQQVYGTPSSANDTSQVPCSESSKHASNLEYFNATPLPTTYDFSAFGGGVSGNADNERKSASGDVLNVKSELDNISATWPSGDSSDHKHTWPGRSRAFTTGKMPPLHRPNFRVNRGGIRYRRTFSSGISSNEGSFSAQGANVSRTLQTLCKTLVDQAGAVHIESTSGEGGDHVYCQICGARLSCAATLANHIRGTHLSMNICQCDICGEKFKWTMQLCRHRRRYHAEADNIQQPQHPQQQQNTQQNIGFSLPPTYPPADNPSTGIQPTLQPGPILHF